MSLDAEYVGARPSCALRVSRAALDTPHAMCPRGRVNAVLRQPRLWCKAALQRPVEAALRAEDEICEHSEHCRLKLVCVDEGDVKLTLFGRARRLGRSSVIRARQSRWASCHEYARHFM